LLLDEHTTVHLHRLAQPAKRRRQRRETVRPTVADLINRWSATPALVLGRCSDVLAANRIATELWAGYAPGRNLLRVIFLDPVAAAAPPDWDEVAADAVASLRTTMGSDLDDPRLTELIGELSLKSEAFHRHWARHAVRGDAHGVKRFIHPEAGTVELRYESFALPERGQTLITYHPSPGSADERVLTDLAARRQEPLDA
jgi:hypothetical protein